MVAILIATLLKTGRKEEHTVFLILALLLLPQALSGEHFMR
jgi:hypothetical protein